MSLRLAIAGAGYFGRFHRNAWARLDGVEVVAVCDADADRAQAAAADFDDAESFTDFAAMLDAVKPELVDIATPPATHLAFITALAARGIDGICQKAFCTSLAEAEAAARRVAEAGTMLAVHENFRFQPWHRKLRAELEAGRIGAPFQATFRLRPGDGQGARAYLERQPYFREMPRFLVHETAVHFIDTFRFLLGEVSAVTARLRRLNPAIAGEDAGLVILEFANGAVALFDGNRLADHAASDRRRTMGEMWLEGARGCLTLNGEGGIGFRAFGSDDAVAVPYDWSDTDFGGDCVYALQHHVLAHLRDGAPLENAVGDYLVNLRVEEAIYRSHAEGRRVEIVEIGGA